MNTRPQVMRCTVPVLGIAHNNALKTRVKANLAHELCAVNPRARQHRSR